jgi:RNA polymerase-binding protein DksA
MADLEKVREQLQARREQLEGRVARIQGHLRSPGEPDSQEHAIEAENDEVLERLDETERRELEEIRLALARIAAGSYGRCARCGESIGDKRLGALPYATLCIACAG